MSKILTQLFRDNSCIFCLTVRTCLARVSTKVAKILWRVTYVVLEVVMSCYHMYSVHYSVLSTVLQYVYIIDQAQGQDAWKDHCKDHFSADSYKGFCAKVAGFST